jgi:hypothetical protein
MGWKIRSVDREMMALNIEGIVNCTVYAEKPTRAQAAAFQVSSICPAQASRRRWNAQAYERSLSVTTIFHEALLLEQLAHQPQRRPTVASALDLSGACDVPGSGAWNHGPSI